MINFFRSELCRLVFYLIWLIKISSKHSEIKSEKWRVGLYEGRDNVSSPRHLDGNQAVCKMPQLRESSRLGLSHTRAIPPSFNSG